MFLKSQIHFLFDQNTTEIKQDTSMIKLNYFKIHQGVIPWTIPMLKYLKVLTKSLRNQKLFSV